MVEGLPRRTHRIASAPTGHANLSTTADVYAHVTPAVQRRAAERMDRIFGAASG